MVSKSSSSDVSAPNFNREPISDEDVIRGFILALGAGGRNGRLSPFTKTPLGCFQILLEI